MDTCRFIVDVAGYGSPCIFSQRILLLNILSFVFSFSRSETFAVGLIFSFSVFTPYSQMNLLTKVLFCSGRLLLISI